MKFSEALSLLEQGKRVRCKSWRENGYCYRDEHGNVAPNNLDPNDMFRVDDSWEVYKEPKKKRIVKMWPAVIKGYASTISLTSKLFPNAESALKVFFEDNFIRLATEYPAVEIEVEDV